MPHSFLILFLTCTFSLFGQEYQLKKVDTNTAATFRGLSIVDNDVAWLSGTKGSVGITKDGGRTWTFNQVNGFETADFRSLYAFDGAHAIIANVGSPASILMTDDEGKTWKPVYTNSHKDAFIDGVDFWNGKEGIMYGDPIDSKMLLLRTTDGGFTWAPIPSSPLLKTGEASFAASGTGIQCTGKQKVTIATGGVVSRLWKSADKGDHWSAANVPIVQGQSTTGIFSIVKTGKTWIVVGGDFKNEKLDRDHHFYSTDGGSRWLAPTVPIRGYRECIELVAKDILIATGPSGTDISYDNGITWKALSDERGLHVVRKARKGSLVMAAGDKGMIYIVH